MDPILEGNTVTVRCTFGVEVDPPTDPPTYVLTDPTPGTVQCIVRDPDGGETPYTYQTDANLVREAEGAYRCRFKLDKPRSWWAKWKGDVPAIGSGAEEIVIPVRKTHVT
jgi:hypothetical protein